MGDITRNISRHEMACSCGCGFDACDIFLMNLLQGTVDHFQLTIGGEGGRVIIEITGPNRCASHNETVQKAYFKSIGKVYIPFSSRSTHMLAKASDFKLWVIWPTGYRTQIPPKTIDTYLHAKYPDRNGFGLYDNRNHADIRITPARWNG